MSNIVSLEKFNNDTLADAQAINRNFETIRTSINDNDSRISELNYKKAENNSVMHLTGEELINGIKTFDALVKFTGGVEIKDSPIISKFNLDSTGFVIKFSNNFVVQVGKTQINANNVEFRITLKEEMQDTNYFHFATSENASYSSSSDYGAIGIKANDTTSILVTVGRNKTLPTTFCWLVCGMAKE